MKPTAKRPAPLWQPLPKGGFTGTDWHQPGAIDGQDPYLVWAEADQFKGYAHRHGNGPLKWLPIVIETVPGADVADLVRASSHQWLHIPQTYLNLPGLRFCSARVSAPFFEALRQQPALRALIARYELGLPVGPHTHALKDPCTVAHVNAAPLMKKPGLKGSAASIVPKGQRLKGPVIGLIDGGLALANQAFLNPLGRTRVQHFWRQDSCYQGPWPNQNIHGNGDTPLDPRRAGPTPADMGYGHELTASFIQSAMARFTSPTGSLDEEALYRHFQLWDLARPVNHGTHVMSLAAGAGIPCMPLDDAASRCDLVAVQLDWSNIQDTSGGAMNVGVLDGLMYILGRCAASAEVVVNISWGTLAGPHDGSSILEAAMDQLIDLMGGRLQITVPAGNAYQSRTHANDTLAPGASCGLHWRVQPDDRTQSFLEIWLPEGAQDLAIELTPPGASAPMPALRQGEGGLYRGGNQGKSKHPMCALIYPKHSALGARGTCALIALAPTFSVDQHTTTAPAGIWQVKLTNHGASPVTFDAYIERDDVALGQHTGARQSYFECADYDTSGNLSSFVDQAENPTPIRRSGTFNSLSTGQRTVSVGGTRRQADAWSHFARYSPQIPDPDAARPQRPGVKTVPDSLQPSDDNPTLWGVWGATSLSGSLARLAGTSSSSPQQARGLINQRLAPSAGKRKKTAPAASPPGR
ncbi:MAG: hypothetical protein WEK74_04805 [Hydrogenophaga sp.]